MSIQLAAKHLAAHGRGPDTTLVHMTPGEVASLQALAQQHGGSLTTNPHTGLPEAGFLSALLPMAAGAGLAAMGMPAGYAALSVGAASAATNGGDLRKGMLAGISAYGGAGMAESFIGAGAAATMGAPAAAPATVLETPAGATSPYALTGSSAATAPSTAGYSLGEPSSYLNKPLPSLVSTAPAEAARAAAAATPAAQQAAALQSMDMGQRFDALKAGASGTNAMNYIKANPFTSLGVGLAAMAPDDNKTPQNTEDTDRGPRAGMRYYPGYGTPLPKPNMQGIEQPFNHPYYAAKGGVTRMASGGITSAPRNQQQLFADYLQRVSNSGAAANGTAPPTNKYDWWKSGGADAPAAAPTETPEQYAARMSLNARGAGGSGGQSQEQRDQREAQFNEVSDYLSTPENPITMNQYFAMNSEDRKALDAAAAERNPIRGGILNAVTTLGYPMFLRGLEALQGVVKDFNAPSTKDYKSVGMVFPTENDRIKAEEAAKYRQSLLGDTSGYTDTSTSEIDRVTTEDARNAAVQKAQAETENDARIQGDLNPYTSSQFSAAALPIGPYASGRNSNYSEPTTGPTISEVGAPLSTNKLVASEKLAASKPIGVTSGVNFTSADARTPYGEGEGNKIKNVIAALTEQQEGIAKDYMQAGQTLGFTHPDTVELKTEYDKYNNEINNLYNRVQYTDPTTNDYKTPFVNYTPAVEKAVAQTNAALTPAAESNAYGLGYVGKNPTTGLAIGDPTENRNTFNNVLPTTNQVFGINEGDQKYRYAFTPATDFSDPNASQLFGLEPSDYEKQVSDLSQYNLGTLAPDALRYSGTGIPDTLKVPDIVGTNEISADPNADKTAETYGIPSAETFAAMIGPSLGDYAAVNNGVVSDAGNGLAGIPAPNLGNRGSSGVAAGFGGLGSAWRTALGLPVVDGQGRPILTSQGAAQQAYNESPQGVQDANDAETRSLLSRYPAPSNDGGDGGDAAGNAAAQTRANDNSATSGGWFGGGSSDARGGYLQNGKFDQRMARGGNVRGNMRPPAPFFQNGKYSFHPPQIYADGGELDPYNLGSYSDGGRLLKGPGDGVSDSIPATIGKGRPARLADGEFVVPARIVSEIGNGSTEAGARKLYAMMDRIQAGRKKSVGKGKVAVNSRADKYLPA
jgi:hypothetical protein